MTLPDNRILKLPLALCYNHIIARRLLIYLEGMLATMDGTIYYLHIKQLDDYSPDNKNYVSTMVLRAIDELDKVIDETRAEAKGLKELLVESPSEY